MTLKFDGRMPLKGSVSPAGSVYSALSLISASLFFEKSVLENVPLVPVITTLLESLKKLGVVWKWITPGTLSLVACDLVLENIDNSALVVPLLTRNGRISIKSGILSSRSIKFYQLLGVSIEETPELVTATFGGLDVKDIDVEHSLEFSLAALLLTLKANTEVNLSNFLITEETLDLIEFLKEAGQNIVIDAKDGEKLTVTAQSLVNTVKFFLPSSTLESAFWASAGVMSGGDITIKSVVKDRLISYFSKLTNVGVHFEFDGTRVRVWQDEGHVLKALDFEVTRELPLYDFLPILVPVLLKATGESKISGLDLDQEPYIKDLNLFNAKITNSQIAGPALLKGNKVVITSFNQGLAVILLALGATGKSEILESEKVTNYIGDFNAKLEQMLGKPL